jgi:hypothetical protein
MTTAQAIARAGYERAKRDERRLGRTDPDSLARSAAECAADLWREQYWTEKMARSASRHA